MNFPSSSIPITGVLPSTYAFVAASESADGTGRPVSASLDMFKGIGVIICTVPVSISKIPSAASAEAAAFADQCFALYFPRLYLRILRFLPPNPPPCPEPFSASVSHPSANPCANSAEPLRRHSPRLRAFGKSLGRHRRRTRFIGSRRIPGGLSRSRHSNLRLRKSIQIRNVHLLQRILKIRRNQIRIARIEPDSRAGEGLPPGPVPRTPSFPRRS